MPRKLTIAVTEETYATLLSAASEQHSTPEELAEQAILARFGAYPPPQRAWASVLGVMRQRGHLAESHTTSSLRRLELPLPGSPERAHLEAEVAADLGAALERSGLSVLDLIER